MNELNSPIKDYYNQLANNYDDDRFANSYGQFIDSQERTIIRQYLNASTCTTTIDLACGTGRFMEYCHAGFDISENMLKVAQHKYPNKQFLKTNLLEPEWKGISAKNALCFHLIMHLKKEELKTILSAVHKRLEEGGYFIFDVPSAERRKLLNKHKEGWHGANSYTHSEIIQYTRETHWTIKASYGIMMLPIHRLPPFLRPLFLSIDSLFNRSLFKSYASYRVYILQKKKG